MTESFPGFANHQNLKNFDLISLKSDVDKLDVYNLKKVLVDIKKSSDIVGNVVKKTHYMINQLQRSLAKNIKFLV